MSQIAVVGPAAEFDLGDKRRLREEVILAFERHDRIARLERVERLLQVGCVVFLEARADGADIHPIMTAPGCQQQTADPAARYGRLFVADDHETLALHTFDLQPIAGSARAVRTVPVLGDDTFQSKRPGVLQKLGGNVLLAANNSDLNLQGANVKAGGNAQLSGNNVNLAAVKADNGGQQNATGARVNAGGNLAIAANNDVNIIGSSAKSGGNLSVAATNGAVNIVTTDVARRTDDGYTKTSGTDQQASQLSAGGNLQVNANTGVLISGSDLTAKGDVGLTSNGDINVTTSQNQSNSTLAKTPRPS